MDSNNALKLSLPKLRLPLRSRISKKSIGWSSLVLVEIRSKSPRRRGEKFDDLILKSVHSIDDVVCGDRDVLHASAFAKLQLVLDFRLVVTGNSRGSVCRFRVRHQRAFPCKKRSCRNVGLAWRCRRRTVQSRRRLAGRSRLCQALHSLPERRCTDAILFIGAG